MNGKTISRKPRNRSGNAATNSESELTLETSKSGSSTVQLTGDSMSEHNIACFRQPKHQKGTHGHCLSVAEKGAIGDGVYQAERTDSPCLDQSFTQNSAEGAEIGTSSSSGQQSDFSDPVFQKLSRLNGEINRMHKDQLRKKLTELHLNTRGVKEVLKKRLKNYYRRKKLAAANISNGVETVPFDFLVVIDFEATCQDNNDLFVQEIIEFPAVLIDVRQNKIIGMFREFCKPTLNPVLSEFCKQLTGVNQSEVDSASEFPVVLEHFDQWLENWELKTRHTFCVVTDGPWDIHRFLNKQCEISQLPLPRWARRWINIRKSYGNFYDTGRLNLNSMLVNLGLEFEGRPHCGLDDSKNIARIVCHLLEDSCALKVNEKLDGGPSIPNPSHCVHTGDRNPSGDFKPLPKKEVSRSVHTASEHSRLDSPADVAKQKTLSGLESDEDISDLLYYFELQSA